MSLKINVFIVHVYMKQNCHLWKLAYFASSQFGCTGGVCFHVQVGSVRCTGGICFPLIPAPWNANVQMDIKPIEFQLLLQK